MARKLARELQHLEEILRRLIDVPDEAYLQVIFKVE